MCRAANFPLKSTAISRRCSGIFPLSGSRVACAGRVYNGTTPVSLRVERTMVRSLLLLVVAAVALVPAPAQSPPLPFLTVAQLTQFLAGAHHRTDGALAKQLDGFVLSERVSLDQLTQWQATLPGPRSSASLTALADASIVFPPPPSDLLPNPPPDTVAQRDLLARARNYVSQTLSQLPDFSAVRTTRHFEDAPEKFPGHTSPLHDTGFSSTSVSYSNGEETRGVEHMTLQRATSGQLGLSTAGEFGPILSIVLSDSAHGSVQWAYWLRDARGKLAVFRYSVPQPHSSYLLSLAEGFRMVSFIPPYHGEIAIDPATGAILSVSIVTGQLKAQNVLESALSVDYGPVLLGGKSYICPLKGIALIQSLVEQPNGGTRPQTQVNDTTFSGYHLMRGDVRILPAQ